MYISSQFSCDIPNIEKSTFAAMIVDVVIPAYNEEQSVGKVIGDIDRNVVRNVVVVDNNSTDSTSAVAKAAGAIVLPESHQGYGAACLKGISWVNAQEPRAEVLVFMDADYSDHPDQLVELLAPIAKSNIDMVIGSRALGNKEKGSMLPQQVFGNWLATTLIKILYKANYTDLGPFRAIKMDVLNAIEMKDRDYGWTVEMQAKIAKRGFTFVEVPVHYRKRIGKSKIAGTVKGTIFAGYKIITTIFKYR